MDTTSDFTDLIEGITDYAAVNLIELKEQRENIKKQSLSIDPELEYFINMLEIINDLFYRKEYKEGFSLYVTWLEESNEAFFEEDLIKLKEYAKFLGLEPSLLDGLFSLG